MKKILLFLISILFVLTFTSCGKDNSIELTLDNYEDYLDVSILYDYVDEIDYYEAIGKEYAYFDSIRNEYEKSGTLVYKAIETDLIVAGKSTNFNYNDVKVNVRVTGEYVPFPSGVEVEASEVFDDDNITYIDFPLSVDTDIAGNGSDTYKLDIRDNCWIFDAYDITYEVIEIKGSVTPTY